MLLLEKNNKIYGIDYLRKRDWIISPFLHFTVCRSRLFVKLRVERIKIPTVQFFLHNTQAFTETLIVYNFAFTQETDRFTDFRVFYKTENIVIGSACFLFCGHIFVQICKGIAFRLENRCSPGVPLAAWGHRARVWST